MRVVFSWSLQWAMLLLSHLAEDSESFLLTHPTPTRRLVLLRRVHFAVGGASPSRRRLLGRRRSAASARPSAAAFVDPGGERRHDPGRGHAVNGEGPSPDPAAVILESLNQQLPLAADLSLSGADLVQPLAPPLSYDKFLRMQDKRVVVTIRYSGESGLRPYFLTVAKKLKASHPDVVIERRILPSLEKDGSAEAVFEILVDGKVVIGKKNRTRRQRVSMDLARSRSVFVSMQELDVAISRARRRRRPTTTYGGAE